MGVGVLHRSLQGFIVKVEVPFVHAHIEVFATQVNGIGTSLHGCFQGIPGAGGSQELYGFAVKKHL